MREEEKEIVSAERVRKYYLDNCKGDLIFNSVILLFLLVIITFLVVVVAGVRGSLWRYIVLSLLGIAPLVVFGVFKIAIPLVKNVIEYIHYKKAVLEVVEATVSLKTARVERERGVRYSRDVNRHYMFFKDYGETLCGSGVKEGDVFYLVVAKTDAYEILAAYTPKFYRMG